MTVDGLKVGNTGYVEGVRVHPGHMEVEVCATVVCGVPISGPICGFAVVV